jgi:hypothetical protein
MGDASCCSILAHSGPAHDLTYFCALQMTAFGVKVAAAFMCVFVTNYKWLSVGLGVCALLLTVNFIRWVGACQLGGVSINQLAPLSCQLAVSMYLLCTSHRLAVSMYLLTTSR